MAEEIQQTASKEIHYRTVINRAYYGAFTSALIYAEKNGYKKDPNKGTHKSLIDFIAINYPKLAKNLKQQSSKRIESDYYPNYRATKNDSNLSKIECEILAETFSSLS